MKSRMLLTPSPLVDTSEDRLLAVFPRVWRLVIAEDMQEIWHQDYGLVMVDGLGEMFVDLFCWGEGAAESGGEAMMETLQSLARRGLRTEHHNERERWPLMLFQN